MTHCTITPKAPVWSQPKPTKQIRENLHGGGGRKGYSGPLEKMLAQEARMLIRRAGRFRDALHRGKQDDFHAGGVREMPKPQLARS